MFRSATVKLTAWYLLIVMVISLAFSGVVYRVGSGELASGLHRQTQRIYHEFPVFEGSPYLRPGDDLTASRQELLARLIAFNVGVFIVAGLASYYLARRTLQPIEEAHARQRSFTADVSHELRTPLTSIKMESEVALMDKAAGKQTLRNALSSNIEEADRLDALVNSLLRLSRLEDAQLRTGFGRVEIKKAATEAISKVQASAEKKRVTIKAQLRQMAVQGDYDSLVQLMTILLDNAIKYSPVESTVQLNAQLDDDAVAVSVRDEGIGIEPAALEHVFDRFYRADSSRQKTDTEGFGLGLSIAKMIADLHDGTITLTSRVGTGTTATVTLPAVKTN